MVNGTDRSDFIVSLSETGVQLKGKAKKMGFKSGSNTVQVIDSKDQTSSPFSLAF